MKFMFLFAVSMASILALVATPPAALAKTCLSNKTQSGQPTIHITVDQDVWNIHKFTLHGGTACDLLGVSVAMDGSIAIAGAPGTSVKGNKAHGAVYVFSKTDEGWTQTARLTTANSHDQGLGARVALQGRTALAISGFGVSPEGNAGGAVHVFKKSHGKWKQIARLPQGDAEAGDGFGRVVLFDDKTVLVSAPGATVNDHQHGKVYVFSKSNGTWQRTVELTAPDGVSAKFFGLWMAFQDQTAFISVPGYATFDQGSVYVFHESHGDWKRVGKLTGTAMLFGISVAFNGETVLIGSPNVPVNGYSYQGAANVYRASDGSWKRVARLTTNIEDVAYKGFGLWITMNGRIALVGEIGYESTMEAYVFREIDGRWQQAAKLVPGDSASGMDLGTQRALTQGVAVITARSHTDHDNGPEPQSSAAYVFTRSPNGWTQTAAITQSGSNVPPKVAADGSTVIIGVPYATVNGHYMQGAVYILTKTDGKSVTED